MQVFQLYVMQNLIRLLAPSSPAFNNRSFFQKNQNEQNQIINLQLQPCDIIFTRTDNIIYNSSRNFQGQNMIMCLLSLINNKVINSIHYIYSYIVLHISPPIISKLALKHLITSSRSPLVIRPRLNTKQKQLFLQNLLNLLSTKYSVSSIPKIFFNQIQHKLNMDLNIQFKIQSLKQSRICSDAIVYALCSSCEQFKKSIQKSSKDLNYDKIGFVLPDNFLFILQSMYPTVYRASNKPLSSSKPQILQSITNKMQDYYKLLQKYSIPMTLFFKLLVSKNPKVVLIKNILSFKTAISKNIYILSLAMSLCNWFGVKNNHKQYTKKLIIMVAILHFIGSSMLMVNKGEQNSLKNKEEQNSLKKYVIPSLSQVEKLILPKPKI